MPQTIEHIEILSLLGIKNLILVITKKDLVDEKTLKEQEKKIVEFLNEFEFNIKFIKLYLFMMKNLLKM